MAYLGYIDVIQKDVISGWAFDLEKPNEPVEVELLVADKPPIAARADGWRDDLLQSGIGDGRHAFEIFVNEAPHFSTVRVRIRGTDHFLYNSPAHAAQRGADRFNNALIAGAPALPWGFSQREPGPADERVCAEIIAAARGLSPEDSPTSPRKGETWDHVVSNEHGELLHLIQAGDAAALARYLCSLPKQRAGEAVLQGTRAYRDFVAASETGKNGAALGSHDQLVTLAQYLGLVRLEAPDLGEYGRAIYQDPADLAQRIEQEIGVSPLFPHVFSDLFGLRVGGGLIEQRGLQGLYAGLRMKSIVGIHGATAKKVTQVCEIGGGFGLAAAFSWKLGFRRYVIVDLPTISLLQYYFLRMALPEVDVRLVRGGEPIPDGPGIYLISAGAFAKPRAETFDLVLNCDSFPEMGEEVCGRYLDLIAERAPLLLSINQESEHPLSRNVNGPRQPPVSRLMTKRSDFTRLYRFRAWLRKGFAEELYRTRNSSGLLGVYAEANPE